MPSRTSIAWCDYSSNPLRARILGKNGWICAKVSPGCVNCYSEAINGRFGNSTSYTAQNARDADHYLDKQELNHILRFRPKGPFRGTDRPKVFAFDMTDVFGDWVPDEILDRLFATFAQRPDVDFLILTKRAWRLREYTRRHDVGLRWWHAIPEEFRHIYGSVHTAMDWTAKGLPNVWLGVSIEDQQRADERIPMLLETPAAVRFLSAEPLLSPPVLQAACTRACPNGVCQRDVQTGHRIVQDSSEGGMWVECACSRLGGISWVICGGESGPHARPMNPYWAQNLREQCAAAGVAFFMKQDSGSKPGLQGRLPDDLWAVKEFPQPARASV